MIPAIFINCRHQPYVDKILSLQKPFETRSRNMLKSLLEWALGEEVLIVETGCGDPIVRGIARIDYIRTVTDKWEWEDFRHATQVPIGDDYDWKEGTKVKYLYHLTDVRPLAPFPFPKDARRHGRTWAEYDKEVTP